MSFHRTAEGLESPAVLNLLSVCLSFCLGVSVSVGRPVCLSKRSSNEAEVPRLSPYCVPPPRALHLTRAGVRAWGCVGWDGGGGVQLMGSITFLLSPVGRHGDRGGDLHRQRDQERPEHVLRQEQGDCLLVFLCFCKKRLKKTNLFLFFLKSHLKSAFILIQIHILNESDYSFD